MSYILARADAKGSVCPKNTELLKACGVAQVQSIRASIRRLEEHSWITTTYQAGIGKPNTYTVQFANLPRVLLPQSKIKLVGSQPTRETRNMAVHLALLAHGNLLCPSHSR